MKKTIISIVVLIVILSVILGCSILYTNGIAPVTKDSKKVSFTVPKGSSYLSLATSLKEEGLIKNETFYKIYIKLNNPTNLDANTYILDTNMGVKKIVDVLNKGENVDNVKLTFKEGTNIRSIVSVISKNTNNKAKDVYSLLKDDDYLDSLIKNYWFITKDIKNKDIYYSLEGYLFPDTYIFSSRDVSIKEIFKSMLDKMDQELTPYKKQIKKSSYSIHELLTLASIVQTEGNNPSDWKTIAGVFYNRLDSNMKLGSCVTCYYGVKRDFGTGALYQSEIDDVNAYNTYVIDGLPVGPIASISLDVIKATLKPAKTDYYYFASDVNGNTYFSKSNWEHDQKVADLKAQGIFNG